MKTKLSKKVLSAVLAVMMVVSSVPITASLASGASLTDSTTLTSAIYAYENKMDGTVYKNMSAAYELYVDAKEMLDAYVYGNTSITVSDLDTIGTSLQTAVDNMTAWTATKGSATTMSRDETTAIDSQYATNLLYAPTATSTTTVTTNKLGFEIAMSENTVVLYDGTEVRIPVCFGAESTVSGASKTSRKVFYCYPTDGTEISDGSSPNAPDNNYFVLKQGWKGYVKGTYNWTSAWSGTDGSDELTGYSYSTVSSSPYADSTVDIPKSTWYMYANYLTYVGSALAFTDGLQSVTSINWGAHGGYSSSNNRATFNVTKGNIYVIDYETTVNAINAKKSYLSDITNYTQGQLSALMTAYDQCTIDPTSYDYSSDAATTAASVAKTLSDGATALNAQSPSTDGSGYQALRDAIAATKNVYTAGSKGWVNDNGEWDAFATAYEAAVAVFTNIQSTSYNDNSNAQTLADDLTAARAALTLESTPIDASKLQALIETYEAYSDIFTDDTKAAADAAVSAAKIAVWQSEDGFGSDAKLLEDTEENEAIYNTQLAAVEAAIEALRIDPSASVPTSYGYYSLNDAIALELDATEAARYSNYATFQTALNTANEYVTSLTTLAIEVDTTADETTTTYSTRYDDYVAHIEALVEAYNSLTLAFTELENGTTFGTTGTTAMTQLYASDTGYTYMNVSYSTNGYIFKTEHTGTTATYGTFDVAYGTNYEYANNALDSITINATADQIAANGNKLAISDSDTTGSKPNALTDDQKSTYAGCLSYNNYSVSNLRLTGKSDDWTGDYLIVDQSGNNITDDTAYTTDLTEMLGTTDGVSAEPVTGAVHSKSDDGSNPGYVYISGDLSYTFADDTNVKSSPTSTTYPSVSAKPTLGTNFGAVSAARSKWGAIYYPSYYWWTSAMNSETINTTAYIVDVSYYFDLIDECDALLADSAKYTDDSWSTFTTALEKAKQDDLGYDSITKYSEVTTMVATLKTRYTALYNAMNALTVKTFDATFNYKDATGADTSTVISDIEYGKTIADYATEFNAIETPSYTSEDGVYTYTFENWLMDGATEAGVDDTTPIKADVVYNAQYTPTINAADWTAYNEAYNALIEALGAGQYATANLQSVKTAVDSMTYFTYTDDQKTATNADEQTAIDTETATLTSLLTTLGDTITYDTSVADSVTQYTEEAGKTDKDRYDDLTDFTYETTVTIDGVDYTGLDYATQDELDTAIKAALSGLTLKTYDIYLNGEKITTDSKVAYGSGVVVNPQGTVTVTDDTNTQTGTVGENYAWTYSYSAPSNNNTPTAAKYMITAPCFGFIIKGDTYLTSTATSDSTSGYTVSVKTSINGKTVNVVATDSDGSFTVPAAMSYTFYSFTGYTLDGVSVEPGSTQTVSGNATLIANFEPDASTTYTIYYYKEILPSGAYGTLSNFAVEQFTGLAYDDVVTLTQRPIDEDGGETEEEYAAAAPYCWVEIKRDTSAKISYFTILAYGETYSFNVSQSLINTKAGGFKGIGYLSKEDYETLIANQSSIDSDTESIVLNSSATKIIQDGTGTPILQEYNGGSPLTPDALPTVTTRSGGVVYTTDSSKLSMIATFALPTGYTVREWGFLFTKDTSVTDMTLENVDNSTLLRLKCSKYTVGNQFVLTTNNPSTAMSFLYTPYAIVEDSEGNLVEVYGTTNTDTTTPAA